MKSLTLCVALAALTCAPAFADDAPRGRWIGNGHDTPREIAANKDGKTRGNEIWRWLAERNASRNRQCNPAAGLCSTSLNFKLDSGVVLELIHFERLNGQPSYYVYCRNNATVDRAFCYDMEGDYYYSTVFDTAAKKWVTVRRENKDKDGMAVVTPSAPSSQPKKTEVEL